jgi:AbrB family looped-hinge helix DNA binding protein
MLAGCIERQRQWTREDHAMDLYPSARYITLGNQGADMLVATSKVTNQGQISVPAEVRKDLGIRAGTELIWDRNEDGDYTVRPKRFTLADLHRMVGPSTVRLTDQELKKARQEFLASRMKRLDAKKA